WLGITLIFVIGMFSGFSWVEQQVRGTNLPRVLARVNGVEISRQQYEQELMRIAQIGLQRLSPQDWTFYKEHILNQMVDEELLRQEAYRRRVRVYRFDINKRVDEILQFQLASLKQQYEQDKDFRDFVRTKYGSLDGMVQDLRSQISRERKQIEQEILQEKLRQLVESEVKVTEDDLKSQYTKFKIRHIFVGFDKFLPKGKSPSEQDRNQAKEKALQKATTLRERILKGEDFVKVAEKESDDPTT
ncbi:MAG: SurA N-terminal domain-containing protein, partial [Armatimonadota bacterium]|nr:SurA N-terminal domain-containing protein [Armatimonadota bacterium]